MSVMAQPMVLDAADTGGLQVAPGADPGSLVTRDGQVQLGPVLMGANTPARFGSLDGWLELGDASLGDTPRPQAHGVYPGSVYSGSLSVTWNFILTGTLADRVAMVRTLEHYFPMDGVERPVAAHLGDEVWYRMARLTGRSMPVDYTFPSVGATSCSMLLVCADPRRYATTEKTARAMQPTSDGGLAYPLAYPLFYGTATSGGATVTNDGSVATPLVIAFQGPLTDPSLVVSGDVTWRLGFNLTLADGESLVVDTSAGTVLLNGNADRLYLVDNDSDPLSACVLSPGSSSVALVAASGSGSVTLSYHDARM